jgi:predicted amino acid racemase
MTPDISNIRHIRTNQRQTKKHVKKQVKTHMRSICTHLHMASVIMTPRDHVIKSSQLAKKIGKTHPLIIKIPFPHTAVPKYPAACHPTLEKPILH